MKVKICGITTEEAALAASEAGADLLGFVFAESKRKITPEHAAKITAKIPAHVKTVGVFVNETYENMISIAKQVDLHYIQLHGDESPGLANSLPYPVIKAFSIQEKSDIDAIRQYECDYYLLDSPGIKYRGGSGIPFDWSLLQEESIPRHQMILAGGLNEDNVAEAIRKVQPALIDVSSGVETNGVKDVRKIKSFINEVKHEEREGIGSLHIT